MLQVQSLSKRFGSFQALNSLSFELNKGEILGFLGPNGAGKTTTMDVIAAVQAESQGRVLLNGRTVHLDNKAYSQDLGYLPQLAPLYPDMKTQAYLEHIARLKGIAPGKRRHAVGEVLDRCDLRPVEKRSIQHLSGGNKRRIGLAQALLGKPALLILDEATAGLDPTQIIRFRTLINELRDDHGILLSTHIMGEVEACCDRVILIKEGKLIHQSTVAELQEKTQNNARLSVQLLEQEKEELFKTALEEHQGFSFIEQEASHFIIGLQNNANSETRSELISLCQQHGGLRELREVRKSLDDVFVEILNEDKAS